jgi:xylulose-5-phosphate/fructose-6-phosphate phosphoketolase
MSPAQATQSPTAKPTSAPAETPLSAAELDKIHRFWCAANYLTVGQIYLRENPLLREPLTVEHIKPRLLGHWGTSPGLSFVYAHVNRLIKKHALDAIFVTGPGHGGPALNACAYLEGSYTEVHPEVTQDEGGMRTLFRQFSTPGGVPSHCGSQQPGSINEGGELGYSLLHAYGAAFDNPDLFVTCVVGDGEAETGPLEGSWKSNKFLNPVRDGAVLPVLHLNGYKISGPTVLARIPTDELTDLLTGHGYTPYLVEGDEPPRMHQLFAATLDRCYAEIRAIQDRARKSGFTKRERWPMIILRTPKGWTGPKVVGGVPVEGTFRAHQVPLANVRDDPAQLKMLGEWMQSYQPRTLFDERGRIIAELAELAPREDRRMSANPHANGGRVSVDLDLPDFGDYALEIPGPGQVVAEAPRKLGELFRDVFRANPTNFRLFCPDETNSNRLNSVFDATNRCSTASIIPIDDHVKADGRVMEVLSEHCCEGWLEGYVLTGRHGVFPTYEAFAQVVDSMLTQHAKWLKECREQSWRRPIPSLNYFLTSHAWRNDHNGFSHQAPGFIDNALVKKSTIVRIYFPPDTNSLLFVSDHCLRSRNYVNLVVCGKQPQLQWLSMDQAREQCSRGASKWDFCSSDGDQEPDVVLACAGDVPTLEIVATAWLLRKHVPDIRVRVVNIIDLGVIMHPDAHPHGMDNMAFESLFTGSAPVIFAFHGYRWVIHSVVHGRANEARFHVRGYMEEGSTTTPFDMAVQNKMSRFQLAIDALKYVPRLRSQAGELIDLFERKLYDHGVYVRENFVDLPEIVNWRWTDDFSESDQPPPSAHVKKAAFTDA